MKWTLPNILTVLRLVAAPGAALAFAFLGRPLADWIAFGLFVGASLTDFLDGWIARAWGLQSRFGAMLDPIADKAMVVIALAVIFGTSGMDPWLIVPATTIFLREVFVSGLREFLGKDASKLSVTKLAKWKTTVQMVAIAILLAAGALHGGIVEFLGTGLLWIAGLLTLVTGWDYLWKALPYLKEEPLP